ncbi:MAG TPA: hypothetical protein VM488_02660 [Pseudobacter sp.]|nr:hypothetical protein [Pseudobacter sp.]
MIRANTGNILLVFFTILLTSCNPTDTFILKSKTDLGLYPGDELSLDLDSVGYIQNIQTIKGEVIYTAVVSRKISLRKHAIIHLDQTFFHGDPYLRIRNKGFGDRISTKDTINIVTTGKKKMPFQEMIKTLVDSLTRHTTPQQEQPQ